MNQHGLILMNKIWYSYGNPYGFFSTFCEILDGLRWCELNGYTPMVKWGGENESSFKPQYWSKDGYNGANNTWEYYFEPIECEIKNGDEVVKVQDKFMLRDIPLSFGHKNIKRYSWYRQDKPQILTDEWAKEANKLIKKYIKVKSEIIKKVDKFTEKNFKDKYVIGMHCRGGGNFKELYHDDNIRLEYYVQAVNEIVKKLDKDYVVYVASDNKEAVDYMLDNLKNVVYYPCHRIEKHYRYGKSREQVEQLEHRKGHSKVEDQLFSDKRALLGEEALIETLLLSSCNVMCHHESQLAIGATYFNPKIIRVHLEKYYGEKK